ncbi:succinylglutamate-semialdehyde dehydrogenase [Caulobacter sp. 17J80-11]|uniref:succinylglutamate-semialdehyde dehydrogenase n=1 Tax=Caulobacter sp. 17J80-11 TaxID=2763502 RepID=UPI0016535566|nr:succinylglutamate-semialdehyde dehydrogenase [Caulobacter sp. 17J80-11]MBC6981239.1 succinylglutamate-semialdehyde dehydrogenase [Caulobacter sp. 17J80-11]
MNGRLFIDGEWRESAGERLVSTDPATGEQVWTGSAATRGEVECAVRSARKAFEDWSERPREERVEFMRRYKAVLQERAPEFAKALSRETGKALWETTAELNSMIGKVDISIRAYAERTGEREAEMAFGRAVLRHKPHGVAVVLGPYNFPGHLPNGHIVPALLAGDTVVFKPSEETPLAGQMLVEALEAAGLPKGVVNLVQGGRETGAALIEQPIDALLFTGSAQAGDFFRRKFADNPHVVLALELGGNNPLVVWDVEDPAAAASLVVQSAYVTTGQRCSCARRLIVKDGAEGDAVIEAVAALTDRLTVGPWDATPEPYMGPLISAKAAEGALAKARGLIEMGGKVVRKFHRVDGTHAFVTPGLFDMTGVEGLPDDEIFAPVLQVFRVSDFDAAIAKANDTKFGLSAGLISDDEARWRRFLARSRAGVVNRNRPTTGAAGDMPFGGVGASGNHRPSAYYAADYVAYPVATFEADKARSILGEIKGLRP